MCKSLTVKLIIGVIFKKKLILKSRFDFGYQQEFKGRLNFKPIEGFEIG